MNQKCTAFFFYEQRNVPHFSLEQIRNVPHFYHEKSYWSKCITVHYSSSMKKKSFGIKSSELVYTRTWYTYYKELFVVVAFTSCKSCRTHELATGGSLSGGCILFYQFSNGLVFLFLSTFFNFFNYYFIYTDLECTHFFSSHNSVVRLFFFLFFVFSHCCTLYCTVLFSMIAVRSSWLLAPPPLSLKITYGWEYNRIWNYYYYK